MFSFFGKSSKSNASSVKIDHHVGSELKLETGLPQAKSHPNAAIQCQPMRYTGIPPHASFEQDNTVEIPEKAFIVTGLPDNKGVALINNPELFRFDVWSLKSAKLDKILQTGKIHPDQDSWLSFQVLDVACLPNNKILLAIGYQNPRPGYALLVFDPLKADFTFLGAIEPNAQDREKYFEYKPVSATAGLALFYTDMKRESAEIYHNYENHFLLFNPEFSNGLEVLTLGIDVGNVKNWLVVDNTLYMEAFDSRGKQEPRRSFWSLDLAKLIH
jgi:hypothetical protein